MNMIFGYILTFFGCFGTVFTYITISNDHRYSYTAPFTNHERTMITILVISIIVLIAGIFTIILSVVKNKNEAKLKEITNMQNNSQMKNKCPDCNLNISDSCTVCPKCGRKLK